MYIEKDSRYFDLIRDLPNIRVDYVVCHSFLGGYRGVNLYIFLWKSINIQYSALTPR